MCITSIVYVNQLHQPQENILLTQNKSSILSASDDTDGKWSWQHYVQQKSVTKRGHDHWASLKLSQNSLPLKGSFLRVMRLKPHFNRCCQVYCVCCGIRVQNEKVTAFLCNFALTGRTGRLVFCFFSDVLRFRAAVCFARSRCSASFACKRNANKNNVDNKLYFVEYKASTKNLNKINQSYLHQ